MPTPKTYSAILKQIALLQHQAEKLRVKESAGVIKRIREAIQAYGISVDDLTGALPKRKPGPKPGSRRAKPKLVRTAPRAAKKAAKKKTSTRAGVKKPAKYADNKGNTWAGGGYMPRWLREYKDQGTDIEQFRVKKEA